MQEAGGAKPTVVVAELGDPKRDPGYWVGSIIHCHAWASL